MASVALPMQFFRARSLSANKPLPIGIRKIYLVFLFIFTFAVLSMAQSSKSEVFALRLSPGQDIKTEIQLAVKKLGWKAACVVTCVGSLNQAHLRFANQPSGSLVPGKLEILSLSGTLSAESCHLHLSVADSTGKTTGGHLLEGNLVYTTAEVVLLHLTDLEFNRETDPATGFKELKIRKK